MLRVVKIRSAGLAMGSRCLRYIGGRVGTNFRRSDEVSRLRRSYETKAGLELHFEVLKTPDKTRYDRRPP